MKQIYAQFSAAIALSIGVAACVPQPVSAPTPSPSPVPTPAPTPTPTPTPTPAPPQIVTQVAYDNWMDAPQTPGDWDYIPTALGGAASFGTSTDQPAFTLWCDRTRRQVELVRHGDASRSREMRVMTETGERLLDAVPRSNSPQRIFAALSANDPLLDAMAISKGRFAVETAGFATLYLPSWPEVTRVIEDCR